MLRIDADSPVVKSQNSAKRGPRGCYGFSPGLLPKGIRLRGGRYYVRRHVPCDVQLMLDRVEVWRSLKTDSLQMALRRMPGAMAKIEAEFERARSILGASADAELLSVLDFGLVRVSERTSGTPKGDIACASSGDVDEGYLALSEAYDRYINDPTHRWSASTRQCYDTSRKLAVSVLGGDMPIAKIARTHCREYLEVLRYLPRNASKRIPKLTAREASSRARERGDADVISAANANVNLANLSSFLNWAVNEELIARNPMRGLRLPDEVAKRDKRDPYGAEQLRTIFNAPLYTGCLDGERGYAKPGDARPRNARFWVPLIALFTGMRLNEICQLDVADVREIDGIRCFAVSDISMGGSADKALKTGASQRLVPLHPILINCGLLSFVEERRREKFVKLFEEIDPGPRGKRAVAFSKWFTQFTRACGAYQARTCFHSFRHNFRDELRAARVDHHVAMALGGWSAVGNTRSVSENYGHGYGVDVLHGAVNRLQFSYLDLSHIETCGR